MSEHPKNTAVRLESCEAIAALVERRPIDSRIQRLTVTLSDCALDTIAVANTVSLLCSNQSVLQELELRNCTGDLGTIITVALTTCKKLNSLSIFMKSSLASYFDRFAYSLGAGLITTSSLSTLRLGIGSCTKYFILTSEAARSLHQGLSKNTSLSSLHLANCRFQELKTVGILAKGLGDMTRLRTFGLHSCYEPDGQPFEDEGNAFLLFALVNNSKLEFLDLSRSKCLDEGMIALSVLLDHTTIRKLDLSNQHMTKYEHMNTFRVIGGLARSSTLEEVNMESNKLYSPYDMTHFAAVLAHNTSIKTWNLTNNKIDSSAMQNIASRMHSMKGLQTLLIGPNNGFDDETSQAILEGMKQNKVLQNIDLDPNLADYKPIQYYTDLNWGGRRFIEQRNEDDDTAEKVGPIPQPVWPTILSRVSRRSEDNERRANLIYFYLQNGSAIFPV